MKCLLVCYGYLGNVQTDNPDIHADITKAIESLPTSGCLSNFLVGDPFSLPEDFKLYYDPDWDAIYWTSEMVYIATGIFTTSPSLEMYEVFNESNQVEVIEITINHMQLPVLEVKELRGKKVNV